MILFHISSSVAPRTMLVVAIAPGFTSGFISGAPLPTVEPLKHCTLGVRYEAEESPVVFTELVFDHSLEIGESNMVEYQLEFGQPYPYDTSHDYYRQVSLRELVDAPQAGQRAVAQSRQCFSQSHGLDHMRGRDVNVFLAQQPRHARHPSNRHGVARGPQMVIPAGRFDARAIAAVV